MLSSYSLPSSTPRPTRFCQSISAYLSRLARSQALANAASGGYACPSVAASIRYVFLTGSITSSRGQHRDELFGVFHRQPARQRRIKAIRAADVLLPHSATRTFRTPGHGQKYHRSGLAQMAVKPHFETHFLATHKNTSRDSDSEQYAW